MDRTQLLAALEGLLYVAGDEGFTKEELANILEISSKEVEELVEAYIELCTDEVRGITVINTAGHYRMATKKEYIDLFRKVYTGNKKRLSTAALEVIAIVAYKQPITRAEIEDIRGTNSENVIRKLVAMSFIKEVGRLDTPGKPILYGTTNDFLDYFNLSSLDELPELADDVEKEVDEEKDLFDSMTKIKITE
ncbi:MAG: SMC-Scp complex subunit ScpB [Bacilli bacterium]|nr:SMC-Scp complex subunit ScpB [Bacilli bacterium]